MNNTLHTITQHWQAIDPLLQLPSNENDYQRLVDLLNQLIDEVGEQEQHPLASLLHYVGTLIEQYEQKHFVEPTPNPADLLNYLLQEHQLKQSDLSEIGSQGVVSEILRGKRQLNARQIQALANRFHISPSLFFR